MSSEINKTIRRTFLLSQNLDDKVKELQEHLGLKNMTSVIEYCINNTHKKELDNYVSAIKSRQPREKLTPEEQAERKAKGQIAFKEKEKQLALEKGMELAKRMDATVVMANNGEMMATWKIYEKINQHLIIDGELGKPVVDLTEEDAILQWRGGTKEEILAIYNRT